MCIDDARTAAAAAAATAAASGRPWVASAAWPYFRSPSSGSLASSAKCVRIWCALPQLQINILAYAQHAGWHLDLGKEKEDWAAKEVRTR